MGRDVRVRFGERLREARTGKGVSQERLAEMAELHRTFVSLIERGERNATLQTIEKLALEFLRKLQSGELVLTPRPAPIPENEELRRKMDRLLKDAAAPGTD